ncbi:effector-associated constant component EACC1 [Sphaerisporangium sp. NPDC004334]
MGGGSGRDGDLSLAVFVLPDPDADPEQAERLARRLRAEIAELDVESAGWAPGEAPPPGAKGADPVTIGAIVVALSASGGVFASVVDTVRDWLGRQTGRHRVVLTVEGDTIELERATADQQRDLVEAFLRRHPDR